MTADQVYKTLCNALDARKWSYEKHEEDRSVMFSVKGDDLPMDFLVFIDEERQLIRLYSPLPFEFEEKKLLEGAIAACVASNSIADGNFDINISEGKIIYRINASYRNSIIGEGLMQYLIDCACSTMDKYNERFFAINKGVLGLDRFIEETNK